METGTAIDHIATRLPRLSSTTGGGARSAARGAGHSCLPAPLALLPLTVPVLRAHDLRRRLIGKLGGMCQIKAPGARLV